MGALTKRFGIRKVSAGGAALALAGTLPLIYLASHGLVIAILACALFIRGMGLSAVGVPSISAAYASVVREDLPMATTALNIVMRIGGPTLTTVCATFLEWRLGFAYSHDASCEDSAQCHTARYTRQSRGSVKRTGALRDEKPHKLPFIQQLTGQNQAARDGLIS